MQAYFGSVAVLAITTIYYSWRAYLQVYLFRRRNLRERVAHMLWAMAERMDDCGAVATELE
jgi:hypothetical protein